MACDCIEEMDALLATKNTKLSMTFGFPRNGGASLTFPTIATEKINTRQRGGAALAIPTYCPFCGVKYEAAS